MSLPTFQSTGDEVLDREFADLRRLIDQATKRLKVLETPPVVVPPIPIPFVPSSRVEVRQTDLAYDNIVGGIEVDQVDIVAAHSGDLAKLNLAATAVVAGSYTTASITVDAKGRLTAAASGATGMINPMTAKFDLIYGDTGGSPPLNLHVLSGATRDDELCYGGTSGGFAWKRRTFMTTKGDLEYMDTVGSSSFEPSTDVVRLGIGSTGDVLTVSGGVPVWAAPSGAVPPGAMVPYGAATAPSGWLLCDGSAVSRSTYSALFAIIGTTFGIGDGSTTFNVPDMRQRFPLGKAASGTGSTLGGTGGAIDHTHDVNIAPFTCNASGATENMTATGVDTAAPQNHTHTVDPPNTTSTTANPPFLSLTFIIKT